MSTAVNLKSNNSILSELVIYGTIGGFFGSLAGRLTQVISPSGGALFGATAQTTATIFTMVEKKMQIKSTVAKVALAVANSFISFMAAVHVTKSAGFLIDMKDARYLFAATNLLTVGTAFLFVTISLIAYSAIVGAPILAKHSSNT